jgi:hypothetical protein
MQAHAYLQLGSYTAKENFLQLTSAQEESKTNYSRYVLFQILASFKQLTLGKLEMNDVLELHQRNKLLQARTHKHMHKPLAVKIRRNTLINYSTIQTNL